MRSAARAPSCRKHAAGIPRPRRQSGNRPWRGLGEVTPTTANYCARCWPDDSSVLNWRGPPSSGPFSFPRSPLHTSCVSAGTAPRRQLRHGHMSRRGPQLSLPSVFSPDARCLHAIRKVIRAAGPGQMGNEKKVDTAQAIAAAVNSPAAEKLAEALKSVCAVPQNFMDYVAGPKRLVDKSRARAEGALIEAKAQAEIDKIRAETADYVLDREMRKTLNRKLIVAEAYKALPPPDQEVPKEAPSRDFIHNFFDEFDGVRSRNAKDRGPAAGGRGCTPWLVSPQDVARTERFRVRRLCAIHRPLQVFVAL